MKTDRPDGLYLVRTNYLVAGLVIENGHVVRCAPILKKRLAYWLSIARRIGK